MSLFLFDLNGTLLDPGEDAEGIQAAVRLAMVHTLAGQFRPLPELVDAVGARIPEAMAPFPDVQPGLERLHRDGHRLVVLTNSPTSIATALVHRAGIGGFFVRVIGADVLGVYKPHRRAYARALLDLGADPPRTWLVAAHDWDVIGAKGVGMRTAFVDREGPAPVTVQPDRTVATIEALALSVQPSA
jgi:FMN phosphatase YigB (HAD superfamily)